ncbi:MAG TPA: hypothetical protein VLG50_00820 [Candidatus Saccharimonadales bacterium]|nr:hypothetical protein [Candidatus Saccharimonadales bacterium]
MKLKITLFALFSLPLLASQQSSNSLISTHPVTSVYSISLSLFANQQSSNPAISCTPRVASLFHEMQSHAKGMQLYALAAERAKIAEVGPVREMIISEICASLKEDCIQRPQMYENLVALYANYEKSKTLRTNLGLSDLAKTLGLSDLQEALSLSDLPKTSKIKFLKEAIHNFDKRFITQFSTEEMSIVQTFPTIISQGIAENSSHGQALLVQLQEQYPGEYTTTKSLGIPMLQRR